MKIIELFFFATCLWSCVRSEQLLHTVDGDVGRGNYTYYSLMYEGPIALYLNSIQGDADLYVSQFNTKPTFDPETYCLQSSTCGLDVVHIPSDFNRPVGIGVYGHPSYETSAYSLQVLSSSEANDSDSGSYPDRDDTDGGGGGRRAEGSDYYAHVHKDRSRADEDTPKEESMFWTLIWSFLDILIEVLVL